ncbi:LysR family transcriptional regulator [Arthrobacter sp. SLBN-100]|uniref:LysR family transcriptional regulator n=1 Tax=Arthrobacter sp. SLBN-100 TaxID=2768450 RepID=UPI001151FDD3|nr:LysR family transcriptional regulator [Arthrobacter sp. SLBN-100]TQJ62146.1 LysR family transcriptional regulator [Arthrobacter sp. SLBN-100]
MRNLYGVDLNLLVALEALLNERNVTRAGEQLGVSQSAMSNTLGRLRRLLDDDILIRVGREWQVTPRAASLQEPLSRMLAITREEVLGHLPFDAASSRRRFRIATANAAAVLLVAPLVTRLMREAPGVVIQIEPIGQPRNELVERQGIDLVLLPDTYGITHPNQQVLSLEWTCVVDRDHPFVGYRFDADSFKKFPHVVYEHHGMATNAHSSIIAAGLGNDQVIVDDFVVIPFLIRRNSLVGLLQDKLAEEFTRDGNFRTVAPPLELPSVRMHMYWHARNDKDPGNRWLRSRFLEIGNEIMNPSA